MWCVESRRYKVRTCGIHRMKMALWPTELIVRNFLNAWHLPGVTNQVRHTKIELITRLWQKRVLSLHHDILKRACPGIRTPKTPDWEPGALPNKLHTHVCVQLEVPFWLLHRTRF